VLGVVALFGYGGVRYAIEGDKYDTCYYARQSFGNAVELAQASEATTTDPVDRLRTYAYLDQAMRVVDDNPDCFTDDDRDAVDGVRDLLGS
jgi:hypothetical protein